MEQNKKSSLMQNRYLWGVITAVLTLVIMTIVFHIWELDINMPINDYGDTYGVMSLGYESVYGESLYDHFFAPYDIEIVEQFRGNFVHDVIAKIIGIFVDTPAAVANLLYYSGYLMTALACYLLLVQLPVQPLIACVGGVLYTFLPYHYLRQLGHIYLANYFIVPLICMAALWVVQGKIIGHKEDGLIKAKVDKKYLLCFLFIFFFAGISDLYYSILGALLLFVTMVMAVFTYKDLRIVWFCAAAVALSMVGILLQNIPLIIELITGSSSMKVANTREPADLERYGLRISQMIFPVSGHRMGILRTIKESLNARLLVLNEGDTATLGLIGTVGFIFSIFSAIIYLPKIKRNDLIKTLGALNIALVLIATIGGASTLIGFITYAIRCYNRMSIYIAAYSLCAIALLLNNVYERIKIPWQRIAYYAGIVALLLFGIWDQTIPFIKQPYEEIEARQTNLRQFVGAIEKNVTDEGMIYQLPVCHNDGQDAIHDMGPYAMLWPGLYSQTLDWSFAKTYDMDNPSAILQDKLTLMSTEQILKSLCIMGFKGVYIDSAAYTQEEMQQMEGDLSTYLENADIRSEDERYVFYNLQDYAENLHKQISETDWEKQKEELLSYGYKNMRARYLWNDKRLGFEGQTMWRYNGVLMGRGSKQFGPYVDLTPGQYKISVCAGNIDKNKVAITVKNEQNEINVTNTIQNDGEITFEINTDANMNSIEVILENKNSEDLLFKGIWIEQV